LYQKVKKIHKRNNLLILLGKQSNRKISGVRVGENNYT